MANHMWICPTKNQDEFYNIRKLMPLLMKEFPQLKFYYEDTESDNEYRNGQYFITVRSEKIDYMFGMECYTSCPFVDKYNKSEMIDELDQMGKSDLGDQLINYIENGLLDPEKCIEIRHTPYWQEMISVCKWMGWYFGAVVFDEGIHPEFVPPIKDKPETKIPTPKQSFIKSFKTWLKS